MPADSLSRVELSTPLKQAEPGLVSTHWPTRFLSWGSSASGENPNSSTRTPGRPSGVSFGESSRSMPHSAPQPITDVPNPLIVTAACRAHLALSAVTITPVALMPNASAKVSSMRMPLTSIGLVAVRVVLTAASRAERGRPRRTVHTRSRSEPSRHLPGLIREDKEKHGHGRKTTFPASAVARFVADPIPPPYGAAAGEAAAHRSWRTAHGEKTGIYSGSCGARPRACHRARAHPPEGRRAGRDQRAAGEGLGRHRQLPGHELAPGGRQDGRQ